MRPSALLFALTVALAPVGAPREAGAQPLPTADAAAEGFSADRLATLRARMARVVSEGQHGGLITLVARNGRIVDVQTFGHRDREQQLPMARDTIVRIYSMSKVVTSVAALTLVEEGRLGLDDPVAQYLPALGTLKIFSGGTADAPTLVPATRPMTVRHLLTHTSGFVYGFGRDAIDTVYQRAGFFQAPTLDAFVEIAARMPLVHEPGTRFRYGISTDILGAVVEKAAGQPFAEVIRSRITEPLRMHDTGFTVPADKRARLAKVYTTDKSGALTAMPVAGVGEADEIPYPDEAGRGFPSGGGGLFSTIDDYARFGQMLLNGGELDGVRVLGRKTVESMWSNHLVHLDPPTLDSSRSEGFGLGGSVRLDLASGAPLGSIGQFGWSGAATTYFNIDPQEGTLALLFTQHMPFNQHGVFETFSTLMYAALIDPPRRP